MYKHCHLTPLCLQGLIKEEKLEKNPHTTYTYKVVGKKKVVIALLTRRAQNCYGECWKPKKWNLEMDFHHPLYVAGPHPYSCSFCLFPIKEIRLQAIWVYISPGYYLKIRIKALI